MSKDYKAELEEAQRELSSMILDAESLQTRIAKQKRKVAALAELADVSEDSLPIALVEGITDAVRTVFRSAGKPLNPAEVRSRVEALGLPPQKNLLASVHTVIRRLLESGEIAPLGDVNFGGGYRWTGESPALRNLADKVPALRRAMENRRKTIGQRIGEPFTPTYSPPDPLNQRGKK